METERSPSWLPIGSVDVLAKHRKEVERARACRAATEAVIPPVLRIGSWHPGQVRSLRLPLVQPRGELVRPTGFFLEVRIVCDGDDDSFVLDVKPDFGACRPRTAELVVVHDDRDPEPPREMIADERELEPCVPLRARATRQLRFHVLTDGHANVPPRMTAELQLRRPDDPPSTP